MINKKKQLEEILDILTEEAAENIQCVSKIRRFGMDSCHPDRPEYTNREHLTEELGDLLCMIRLAVQSGMVCTQEEIEAAAERKLEKLQKFSNIFKPMSRPPFRVVE